MAAKSGKIFKEIKAKGKGGEDDDEIDNESPSRRARERLKRTDKYCCRFVSCYCMKALQLPQRDKPFPVNHIKTCLMLSLNVTRCVE